MRVGGGMECGRRRVGAGMGGRSEPGWEDGWTQGGRSVGGGLDHLLLSELRQYRPLPPCTQLPPLIDYTALWDWLRDLYQRPEFRETTNFYQITYGYAVCNYKLPNFLAYVIIFFLQHSDFRVNDSPCPHPSWCVATCCHSPSINVAIP